MIVEFLAPLADQSSSLRLSMATAPAAAADATPDQTCTSLGGSADPMPSLPAMCRSTTHRHRRTASPLGDD